MHNSNEAARAGSAGLPPIETPTLRVILDNTREAHERADRIEQAMGRMRCEPPTVEPARNPDPVSSGLLEDIDRSAWALVERLGRLAERLERIA